MNFESLANQYKTPLYVYDFSRIRENFLAYQKAFVGRKSLICFALKANSNLCVISEIAKLEGGADCVSIGEVKRAILAGIKPYRIIFSGVGKCESEIQEALKLGILFLNVESEGELFMIERVAKELKKPARISLRINPDINPKTHPYISTGLDENKFGITIQEAKRLYLYAHQSEFLNPIGIHCHIGSQLTELEPILQAAEKMADFMRSLLALGLEIRFFDMGGGLGICYQNEKTIDLYDYAQGILKSLKELDVTIICEPGRSIVGDAGYLVTRVLYEKKHKNKRFVIVDAGMNDLIRPSLYNAYHRVNFPHNESSHLSPADVVGPICESGDFLAKNILLPDLKEGDLLVFENSGAYGFTMSSNYNTRPRAAEVGIDGKKDFLIKNRESLEEMLKDELMLLERNG